MNFPRPRSRRPARTPPARPRPRPRRWRAVLAPVGALAALGACAPVGGAVDDGPAPALAAPETPSQLWPEQTPPAGAGTGTLREQRYRPVPGARNAVPADRAAAKKLLAADPNVPAYVRAAVRGCTGQGCPRLRPVAHRDLTGDGRDEAVVAVDDPSGRTLLVVYTADGGSLRPALLGWWPLGTTAATLDGDLLVTSAESGVRTTTVSRFHWNGEILSPRATAGRTDPPDTRTP